VELGGKKCEEAEGNCMSLYSWERHEAHRGKKRMHANFWWGKLDAERLLRRPRYRW
jgi:hypothetical protein